MVSRSHYATNVFFFRDLKPKSVDWSSFVSQCAFLGADYSPSRFLWEKEIAPSIDLMNSHRQILVSCTISPPARGFFPAASVG
jgi:hypothetical protein